MLLNEDYFDKAADINYDETDRVSDDDMDSPRTDINL